MKLTVLIKILSQEESLGYYYTTTLWPMLRHMDKLIAARPHPGVKRMECSQLPIKANVELVALFAEHMRSGEYDDSLIIVSAHPYGVEYDDTTRQIIQGNAQEQGISEEDVTIVYIGDDGATAAVTFEEFERQRRV